MLRIYNDKLLAERRWLRTKQFLMTKSGHWKMRRAADETYVNSIDWIQSLVKCLQVMKPLIVCCSYSYYKRTVYDKLQHKYKLSWFKRSIYLDKYTGWHENATLGCTCKLRSIWAWAKSNETKKYDKSESFHVLMGLLIWILAK